MSHTPLPDLERELHAAARRLERAAPRRAWSRHAWAIFSIAALTTGAGVAYARVAHVGPFAYLDRIAGDNPKLAPASTVQVEAPGTAPAWRSVAFVNRVGDLCITGGRRDLRTNPAAPPTERNPNNPPATSMLCAGSDEIAQTLVDPDWPGATFANTASLDGSPDLGMFRTDAKGRVVPVSRDMPTRLLVYAAAPAGVTPVVRWDGRGKRIEMHRSAGHLTMTVDKSRAGLSSAEYARVSTYPDRIDIVLWAAEVSIPRGVMHPQVAQSVDFPGHRVDDSTVELLTDDALTKLAQHERHNSRARVRGISRDPLPVARESAAQRAKIAAFARTRTAGDAVPASVRPRAFTEFQRVQYGASRRLTIAGGGVTRAWVIPGALRPQEEEPGRPSDLTCLAGATIFGDCKYATSAWRRPMVEAVSCSRGFAPGESFVWALSPPGATQIQLRDARGSIERLRPAELVALRRDRAAQPVAIRWVLRGAAPIDVRVPWPKSGPARCGSEPPAWTSLRRDSAGGSRSSGGPRG